MSNSPQPSDLSEETIASLSARIDSLESRLSRLHRSVIRAYEATPSAAVALLHARRSPAYGRAYAANPLVTVRIGTYAPGEELFNRVLASVQQQSYAHWEAVVVCDGADEETARRIASLGDPRLRCFQRPRNGPYPNDKQARWQVAGVHPFNDALAQASGAWIAPIDQDDEWTEDHLAVLLDTALRTRAEVVYGVGQVHVAGGGETYFGRWPPQQGDFGFQTAIQHASLTAFLYDVNSYLTDEPADWNLARRMLEAGVRFEFVEHVVTSYYVDRDAQALGWWQNRLKERGRFTGPAG